VCVREFTFEKVVGAQICSFMGERTQSIFKSRLTGTYTRDFSRGIFFPRADMPSRGVFGVLIFAQEKVPFSG
jgi:hypothetical protein